ncbi:MAG: galactose-1-phosphate uridylyltransferase [Desulfobulbaceae bacterium]|jgi:UDPglucose--hexose-1-phosphate uridylyltransferase|nr:galactose-1-phosphate uridylyltransferase [Desulfobulbaceae bacterium]
MPELRRDPVLGRWIIIATERRQRPTDFVIEPPTTKNDGFCPLCSGHEYTTPPEVWAYRPNGDQTPNAPNWLVRVVPNKYPALRIEGSLNKAGEGMYDHMNGIGAHELVIESPNHDEQFAYMAPEKLFYVLLAYRERILDLKKDPRFRYVMIFKNHGRAAGASLEHSHSQLIALPIIPQMIVSEMEGAASYYHFKERCVYCDVIAQEIHQNIRVIDQNEDFIVISPYAPRTPFEMWVMPKAHDSDYSQQNNNSLASLARMFSQTLRQLDKVIPGVPYNFVLHTNPLRSSGLDHYHWHLEIVPKLTSIAGFEWGSGFYINPMPPEEATRHMKEAAAS